MFAGTVRGITFFSRTGQPDVTTVESLKFNFESER